jgi:outer membrane protein assembly factor BamE
MRILLISLAVGLLSACNFVGFPGVYKIDVEQGNIITQEIADQLKPGMSRRQVRFILGTPLLADSFNLDRWDYIYVVRNGLEILDESELSVHFEGDSLATVTGDYLPPAWASKAAIPDEIGEEAAADDGEDTAPDETSESAKAAS